MLGRLTLVAIWLLTWPAVGWAQPDQTPSPREVPASPPPPPPTFDLDSLHAAGGLTADAAAERALSVSPGVERAEAAARLSEAAARRARLGIIPRIDLSARYTRLSDVENPSFGLEITPEQEMAARDLIAMVSDPAARTLFEGTLESQLAAGGLSFPTLLDQYALRATVSYPVTDLFLSILPAMRAANQGREAARLQVEVERASIELSAREAYWSYVRARAGMVVAESAVDQVDAHRDRVAALVDAGAAPRVDLMRVEAQLASSRVAVTRARAGVAVASAALRQLLRLDSEADLGIGEDLRATPPLLSGDRDSLVRGALDERAEVRALRQLQASRQSMVTAYRGGLYPRVAIQANFDLANPNNRVFPQTREWNGTWDLSAVLSWSPNDMLEARERVTEAQAELAQVEADLTGLTDAVQVEVVQALEEREAARAGIEAASAGLAAAEETYRVRFEQLAAGAAVSSDLIDANAEVTRARLDVVDATIDLRLADARLRRAVGAD